MKDNCIKCGNTIVEYQDTEWREEENILLLTYKCACGCYAE